MSTAVGAITTRPRPLLVDWAGFICLSLFALALPLGAGHIGVLVLPPMLYELAVAATFLMRGRSRRHLPGITPRIAAYGATFVIPVFMRAASAWAPSLVAAGSRHALLSAGATLWLFGTVIGFWPIWHLRRSFSIEPEARELVTSGPYQLARHPIYAAHILVYTGAWLLRPTLVFGIVLLVWLLLLRVRVGFEEKVLTAAFPEYERYRERVGRFGPRLLRSRVTRAS